MEPLSTVCYLYTSKLTMNSLLVNYRGRDADVVIIGFTLITDHLAQYIFTILGILGQNTLRMDKVYALDGSINIKNQE